MKDASPRTSVVIPCYRDDRFLAAALQSVAGQTQQPLEIIVIDDGSPEPLKQPDFWQGPPLRWIRTKNNGLGAARNQGIRLAEGEFIGLLDADDLWEPEKLAVQEAALDQNADAVACYTQCVAEAGFYEFGPYPEQNLNKPQLAAKLWYGQFFPPSSVLMNRNAALEVGGFREGLKNGEDLDMWFRLFTQGEIVGVEQELTKYRIHDGQITSSAVRTVLGQKEARRDILQSHADLLIAGGIASQDLWDAYRQKVANVYFRRNFSAARPMLWDYWKDHPADWRMLMYWMLSHVPARFVAKVKD